MKKINNKKVAIIGAGASGIISAITISKYMNVVLFEKMPRIGKKIIASGNGKCNLTNMSSLTTNIYNNELAIKSYNTYNPKMFRDDLLRYGVVTNEDQEKRVYPLSNSSNSIIDNFLYHLECNQVLIYSNTTVVEIVSSNEKYDIITADNKYYDFDYVIISTGGKSNKQLGSNGEGYQILEKLNVKCTNLYPGLVGLKINKSDIIGLEGLRQKAIVSLTLDDKIIFKELGEIQFKKDGISGIVVMNTSSIIARNIADYKLYVDLVPSFTHNELRNYFEQIKLANPNMDNLRILKAVFPKMLAQNIYNKLKDINLEKIVNYVKKMPLEIVGRYDFDNSQITIGGIKTDEIKDNFELKKHPNIYVIGEILDVDGLCGGYNLHFAFASGNIASKAILKKEGISYE